MGCCGSGPNSSRSSCFDKESWKADISAFRATCHRINIPLAVERSRSGNGAHIWIFFSEPVPAILARRLGSFLLTKTLDDRSENCRSI